MTPDADAPAHRHPHPGPHRDHPDPSPDDLDARLLHREDLDPRPGECHPCYVERLLARLGCPGDLRLTRCWQVLRAPAAVALERRLQDAGAACDGDVLSEVYEPTPRARLARAADAGTPACTGVRRGSTRPCTAWRRRLAWSR